MFANISYPLRIVSFCQTEYYVDAEKGNDSPTYGSKTNPWKTLTYAISLSKEVQAIIYLKKDQSFSDLASKLDVTNNLTIKCWTDEETISLSESYSTILLKSSRVSFWVTVSLTFDGIRFQKPDNISAVTLINMNSSTRLLLQNVDVSNYLCNGIEALILGASNSSIYVENTRFSGLKFSSTSLIKFIDGNFSMNRVNMTMSLSNSAFERNSIFNGTSGMIVTGGQFRASYCNFTNNRDSYFQNRYTNPQGTGVLTIYSLDVALNNLSFASNSQAYGGALYVMDTENFSLMNSTLQDNQALFGGAMYIQNATGGINNVRLLKNTASLDGGAIYVRITKNFSLVNSTLQDNQAYYGGAVYIQNGIGGINNVSFLKNTASYFGGAILVMDIESFSLVNSTLQDNQARFGGAMYIQNAIGGIKNVSLLKNTAPLDGGVIYVIDTENFSLVNSTLQENQAAQLGGAVYIQNATGEINNASLLKNTASYVGGAIWVMDTESFSLVNSVLQDNQAQLGGAVYIQNATGRINNVSLLKNTATLAGGAIFVLNTKNFSLVNSTVQDHQAAQRGGAVYIQNATGGINNVSLLKNTASLYGGAIFVVNSENFSLVNSTLQDNQAAEYGGAVYIENATGRINNVSLLKNNASLRGGAIFVCNTKNFSLVNSTLQDNQAELGGAVYIENTPGRINNVSLLKNTAPLAGGAIFVLNTKNFSLVNSTVQDHQAAQRGGAVYIQNATGGINNVSLLKNTASLYGGAIFVVNSENFSLVNSTLQDNQAVQRGGAVYIENAPGRINNVNLLKNTASLSGGAIYVIDTENFSLVNSILQDNQAAQRGGAVYIQNATGGISNVSLLKNTASFAGGAIFVIATEHFSLVNSTLQDNQAQESGGALFIKNTTGGINNVSFLKNTAYLYGGAIYVLNTANFFLVNSTLQDNQAQGSGGALFIKNNARMINYLDCWDSTANPACGSYADKVENGTLMISNSTFKQNIAYLTGGGAHFEGMHNLILDNTTFLNNSGYVPEGKTSLFASSLKGGAIFYSCEDFNCSPKFTRLDVRDNSAETGGAMYFNNHIFDPNIGNNFTNNSANQYGHTFASSPVQILTAEEMKNDTNTMIRISLENGTIISRDDFIQEFFIYDWTDSQLWKRFSGQTTNAIYPRISLKIEYENQVAGDPLLEKLSFYALDYFGQQIRADNSTYYLKSIPLSNTTSNYNKIEVSSVKGEFIFNNFKSQRNKSITLGIQTNINCTLFNSSSIIINIKYRECRIGETLAYNTEVCTICPSNTYSLLPPDNSSVVCKTCDNMVGAMCKEGGSTLTVRLGYWRFNQSSLNIIRCLNPDACTPTAPDISSCSNPNQLKPDIIENTCNSISNLDDIKALNISCTDQKTLQEILEYCKYMQNGTETGYCNGKKGYKGVLCTECIEKWGKLKNNECVQCTFTALFFVLMISVGLIKIGLIAYTVIEARKDRKYQIHSTMLKIFITFFQIESLLFSVPMYWPPFVDEIRRYLISFFSSGLNPGGYSYDCILPNWLSHFEYNALYAFFAPIIWTVAIGVILLIRKFVFKIEIPWETAQDILKITFLVTYFYFWPDMITNVFSTWNIMDIGARGAGEWRLVSDPTIKWFSKDHIFILCFGMAALIIFGLCLPILLFLKMWKNENLLDDKYFLNTYGFLYRGYRKEYYLWEFVILFRKMLLVCTSVFLARELTFMCITLSIIIVASFVLQLQFSPFKIDILNKLELIALLCLVAINYGSLYHLNLGSTISTVFFLVLALGATGVFVLTWIGAYKGVFKKKIEPVYRCVKNCLKGCWGFLKRVWRSQPENSRSNTVTNLEINQEVSMVY